MEGRVLGSYEILESLGSGGQGHVYRARDTALDREIAVKILPAAFTADPARLKQFQQEAKMLAAASHPNIAAVYAIEEFEEVRFFTQELVPGETLADKLKNGPLDLLDTLEIARQVAAALETAHEKRLIHRDLKPANVMVQPDGRVKVLDFGLALPVDREGDDDYALSDSAATISRTADSVIVGTAPYMSPDQARGKMVDQRTDIWSFGCVLYECLSGERPFEGDTLLDTLSAIVRSEPDWEVLPPTVPRRLKHLIQRCLRKRVTDRLQHVGDARIVLEELIADPNAGQEIFGDPDSPGAAAGPRASSPALLAGAVAAGLVLGAAAMWGLRPAPASLAGAMRPAISIAPVGLDLDNSPSITVHPDGRSVVYAGRVGNERRLYSSSLDAFDPVPIDGTGGAMNPFYSPDGEWIGFFTSNFKLARVPAAGGVVVPIADVPVGNSGAAWLDDGSIVYSTFSTGQGLLRIPPEGGEPQPVTELDLEAGETGHAWPHALPGSTGVVFTVTHATGNSIGVVDLESGEHRRVVEVGESARFVNTGHLIYAQGGSLLAVEFDLDTLTASGAPRVVVGDLYETERPSSIYEVGNDGRLVYVPGRERVPGDRFVWVDRDGSVEVLPLQAGTYGHPRLSPDGNFIAYDSPREGGQDIWVYDIRRQTTTRLTNDGDNVMPVWWPDGSRVLFASSGRGESGIYWRRADAASDIAPVSVGKSLWPVSTYRAGSEQGIAYYELNPTTGRDIWVMRTARDGTSAPSTTMEPQQVQVSEFNERSPVFSPDGNWVAFVSNRTGIDEVYVKGLEQGGGQYTISNGGGTEPRWSADGTELYYRSRGYMFHVPVRLGNTVQPGTPNTLFEADFKTEYVAGNQYYDVSSDGRFLMIQEDPAPDPDRMFVILDFARALAADTN